ncbi:hypothetical protein B9Z55_007389 [Caenorhabditis nigoni]|uniref:Uncharacterized protein n=1 Tax=Caenorhabditis nigoni TaxID=1611254 RepID=A0A2G5V9F1_9PELO|nr:hypothetical protein B9Z55_007389 [Caenorhabditis nigoni]
MINEGVPAVVLRVPEESQPLDQIPSVTQLEHVPLDVGLSGTAVAVGDNSWSGNFPMYMGGLGPSSDSSPNSSNASYESWTNELKRREAASKTPRNEQHFVRKNVTNEEIGARRIRQELKKRKESRRNEKRAIIRSRLETKSSPGKFEDAVEHCKSSALYNDPYLKELAGLDLFYPESIDKTMPQPIEIRAKTAFDYFNAWRRNQTPEKKEWLGMTDEDRQRWLEKEEAVFEEMKVQLRLGFVTILKYEQEEMEAIKKLEMKNQEDKFWNIFAENLKKYPRHDFEPFPFHIYF